MILVDSNIPMYLVGSSSRHKLHSQHLVQTALSEGERLVTDAEVLQEICHRYASIGRHEAIQPTFDAVLGVVDDVLPIDRHVAETAKDIVLSYASLSARDAVHAAVMRRYDIDRIMTLDRGLDSLRGIERIG